MKEFTYFLRSLEKLRKYNKTYLIYIKIKNTYFKKKYSNNIIYISNIELQN